MSRAKIGDTSHEEVATAVEDAILAALVAKGWELHPESISSVHLAGNGHDGECSLKVDLPRLTLVRRGRAL